MQPLTQWLENGVPELPAAALFFIFFFGTFVSEDAACLLAGTAAASGRISLAAAVLACLLGIFTGDLILYAIGRVAGPAILEHRFVRRIVSDRTIENASVWLAGNGLSAVLTSRLISGLRLPTYLLAGALKAGAGRFTMYFLIAALIWAPLLVASAAFSQAYVFNGNLLLGFVLTIIGMQLVLKLANWKRRRLLIGKVKRLLNWEFWPLAVFYAPVVVYVIGLSIRHGGLNVFTAANPAIRAGGFKGESKNEIYTMLQRSVKARGDVLKFVRLECEMPVRERLCTAWRFIDEHGLTFPLVVKPDAGERGKNVRIVRLFHELDAVIAEANTDLILQEYAAGVEFSVFYYRYPHEDRGRIFSITEKRFPNVIGDGKSTLEDLILGDSRAVCLARKYLEANKKRLEVVPRKGEPVPLAELGTHSRGAIFLDGEWLRSESLENRINEIGRDLEGFYFGRFDIRAPSFGHVKRGECLKIVELNGVTSESTNIYDPKFTLFDAYRILFRQWKIAFAVGAANIGLGARPASLFELVRATFEIKDGISISSGVSTRTVQE